jgi:aquaporin NIP
MRRCAAEASGTFILVLLGPGAAAVDRSFANASLGPVGVALAFFFALLAGISAFAPTSGAHFNPAVTIAFWSIRRFPGREVLAYILAQCVGAIAAAIAIRATTGEAAVAAATLPTVSIATAFGVEFVFSAILMAVILGVSTNENVPPVLAALAVAGCVGGLALLGSLTGASMNPARSFGPALASEVWRAHWLYWLAPITGMLAAARVHTMTQQRPAGQASAERPLGVEGPIALRIPAGL